MFLINNGNIWPVPYERYLALMFLINNGNIGGFFHG